MLRHGLPSRALRAARGPHDARPLRLRRSSRSLTLAATVLASGTCSTTGATLASCPLYRYRYPSSLGFRGGNDLQAPSPALRAVLGHPASSAVALADARAGRARRFPAELQGSAGTGNRPTIRKPCSTLASAMRGSAMLRLRRSPRPLSPAPTVTSASTKMNVWRSRARLRRRAGASAFLWPDTVLRRRLHRRRCAPLPTSQCAASPQPSVVALADARADRARRLQGNIRVAISRPPPVSRLRASTVGTADASNDTTAPITAGGFRLNVAHFRRQQCRRSRKRSPTQPSALARARLRLLPVTTTEPRAPGLRPKPCAWPARICRSRPNPAHGRV